MVFEGIPQMGEEKLEEAAKGLPIREIFMSLLERIPPRTSISSPGTTLTLLLPLAFLEKWKALVRLVGQEHGLRSNTTDGWESFPVVLYHPRQFNRQAITNVKPRGTLIRKVSSSLVG